MRILLSRQKKNRRCFVEKVTVFWDVDTQFDFMQPEGKLYVPGAETIIPKVSDVRRLALAKGYSIIADVDWHSLENDEISETPDFRQTFPPHCMAGGPGAERVGFLGELPIDTVEIERMDTDVLRKLVSKKQFHIVIRKNSLDVFSNPNTDKLVELVRPKRVIVFGVALDFCVSCVVRGLSKFPGVRLCALKDVVKGLGTRAEQDIFNEFEHKGVEITELSALERGLQCG
jgi:nicotinamidase/pyrazinamidase